MNFIRYPIRSKPKKPDATCLSRQAFQIVSREESRSVFHALFLRAGEAGEERSFILFVLAAGGFAEAFLAVAAEAAITAETSVASAVASVAAIAAAITAEAALAAETAFVAVAVTALAAVHFRYPELASAHPDLLQLLEYVIRHSRRKLDRAVLVVDNDLADRFGIEADLVDDRARDVARLDVVHFAHFEAISLAFLVRVQATLALSARLALLTVVVAERIASALAVVARLALFAAGRAFALGLGGEQERLVALQ